MNKPRDSVLIVSNGRGEDTVGAILARTLADHLQTIAYPLVGTGDAYTEIPMLDPRRVLPSGGFALRGNWHGFVADLRTGGLALWRQQRHTLREQRDRHHAVLAVGDTYCLWMASLAESVTFFVATAKSEYNERHRAAEVRAMRRHAVRVFTRDEPTARALAARGLPARYVGNPLIDAIPAPVAALPLPRGARVVLILPGSRADAVGNLLLLLKVCSRVSAGADAAFVCALPPTVQMAWVARAAGQAGWQVEGASLRSGLTKVLVTRDFGSALRAATVVAGLAGTANEQAAGSGIPVVAFPVAGAAQFTPQFLRLQSRLLGEAVMSTTGWEAAAGAVTGLLLDPAERARRGAIGRVRMGTPGAVKAIAEEVLALTSRRPAGA